MNLIKLLILLAFLNFACGWGPEGHSIVAQLAAQNIKASTTNAITKYLPSGTTMASISSLADTYRSSTGGAWSAPLHYLDLLRNQTKVDMNIDCADGCVISAILNYTSILRKSGFVFPKLQGKLPFRVPLDMAGISVPFMDEPNALEFLVHFVGDVHQPLHCGWADDEGGNLVAVKYNTTTTNLHSVWDSRIISSYNTDFTSFTTELQNMINTNSSLRDFTKQMDPIDWAQESFDLVRIGSVYVFNSTATPPLLGDWYYEQNLPVVKLRLIAGGLRLGALLDSIFSP